LKSKDDTEFLKTNSILEKDILSSMGIEEDEINPHNEVSGMDDSHAICESLISAKSLLQISDLKTRILKMLPYVVEH
jgi:hypothetical protein